MRTKISDCSYTDKNGYTWRKRFKNSTINIVLKTRDHNEALKNATLMTMKFLEYSLTPNMDVKAIGILLKSYRDTIVISSKMASLQAVLTSLNVDVTNPTLAIPAVAQVAAVELKQAEAAVAANPRHTFEEAKTAFLEANPEWRGKTVTQSKTATNRLIAWAATNNIMYVEDLTRNDVELFKKYLDGLGLVNSSKNTYLNRYVSLYHYLINVKEWVSKNPFAGAKYKNLGTGKKKVPMTHPHYQQITEEMEDKWFWMCALMHHCGLRMNEAAQITSRDFVEIRGIKCVSIYTNDGKTLKNTSSIRDIPLNDDLLAMGIWEEKPHLLGTTPTWVKTTTESLNNEIANVLPQYTTHCFRHGMECRLQEMGVQQNIIDFIMGHSPKGEGAKTYTNRKPLSVMLEALNKAALPEADGEGDHVQEAIQEAMQSVA
ncbi:hypothetical protein AWI06_21410 [Enterobacter hormaechei subsp. xiangfangensis]|uniref:hypothetical protein n=1 Tax=Enterobacter hormaechei TaxID=158836 RepID=UPI0007502C06|nr:hypothetical protein [Enterobacter hormaechei]KUP99317.1 hypothetical protein AWI06_21410 [Enterobacter hormaechei subsp. xiangfangensis]MBT1774409.1 hypothetical protein [Enterobacter hormaechei subsp. xiangfangensis]MDN4964893.1 hypothetical protein [Enterobacter hormaechei]MDO6155182.1 hypothetical protein [Enterobacter hormaechei]